MTVGAGRSVGARRRTTVECTDRWGSCGLAGGAGRGCSGVVEWCAAAHPGRGRQMVVSAMRVAVVYESLMGNTRRVAEAIAAGARDAASGVQVS